MFFVWCIFWGVVAAVLVLLIDSVGREEDDAGSDRGYSDRGYYDSDSDFD